MLGLLAVDCSRGGRAVVVNVQVELASGELLLLEGANGAGKSTLLRTIAGLQLPSAGAIHWHGVPSRTSDRFRRDLLFVAQAPAMKDDWTPLEALLTAGDLGGERFDRGAASTALQAWGLMPRQLARPLRELSLGQRRRAALARLQLTAKPLWLLDEPTAGLDREAEGLVADALLGHLERGGCAIAAIHLPLDIASHRLRRLRLAPRRRADALS